MTSAHLDGQATVTRASSRALLAVSEAFVAPPDSAARLHELATRPHHGVRLDSLALFTQAAGSAAREALALPGRRSRRGACRLPPSRLRPTLSASR